MRYSNKITLKTFLEGFSALSERFKVINKNPYRFCEMCLLSLDFKLKDFKIGKEFIFFRNNKHTVLEEVISRSEYKSTRKFLARSYWKRAISAITFMHRMQRTGSRRKVENEPQCIVEPTCDNKENIVTEEQDSNIKTIENGETERCIQELKALRINVNHPKKALKRLEKNVDKPKKKAKHREKRPNGKERYKYSAHMPATNFNERKRCKLEGCRLLSSFYCLACNVHLCIKSDKNNTQEKNCFVKFHTLSK